MNQLLKTVTDYIREAEAHDLIEIGTNIFVCICLTGLALAVVWRVLL